MKATSNDFANASFSLVSHLGTQTLPLIKVQTLPVKLFARPGLIVRAKHWHPWVLSLSDSLTTSSALLGPGRSVLDVCSNLNHC